MYKHSSIVWRALSLVVLVTFCGSAYAAKVKVKYHTTDAGLTLSKTTMVVDDVPGHELTQQMTIRNYNVSVPDYDVKETWVYEQSDTVAGTGVDRGPNIDVMKNGDRAFYLCEPALKTVTKDDKSWETTWTGKCRVSGGTGKLKNVKGTITFKGKATPDAPFVEDGEYDIEY